MQRLRIAAQRSLTSVVILGLVSPLTMTGCETHTEDPVAKASAGQAAAKSSMDFMRKNVASETKPGKTKTKGH